MGMCRRKERIGGVWGEKEEIGIQNATAAQEGRT